MKLYFSPTSPFVRKVRVCAILRGIGGQITLVRTDPWASTEELVSSNPLSKVPCLITEDGMAMFESSVICDYLDSVGDAAPLYPSHGAARWLALRVQALADGMTSAGVLLRQESARPEEAARSVFMARQRAVIARALDWAEANLPAQHLDIGGIALVCGLGWMDFRKVGGDWRSLHPRLTAWYDAMMQEKAFVETRPYETA